MRRFFVTGTGTGIGKTIVSAIITEALKADYWKPVQCGNLDRTDTDIVRSLVGNTISRFHKESFRFAAPISPHAASALEGIVIDLSKISVPKTNNTLIIEGAGGLMVPLNEKNLVVDLIKHFEAEAILVSQNYLGSINHTLLSAEALKKRGIKTAGIIFNGPFNKSSESIILKLSGLKVLGKVAHEKKFTKAVVKRYSVELRNTNLYEKYE